MKNETKRGEKPKKRAVGIFRDFFRFIFSRTIITALLIIAQIVWLWLLLTELAEYSVVIRYLTAALAVVLALVIINKDEVPEYKLPWLVIVVVLPILGGLLYFFFGINRPARWMRRRRENTLEKAEHILPQNDAVMTALKEEDALAGSQAEYLFKAAGSPVFEGGETRYFPMGEDMFPVLVEEVKKAKKFVFLEYFIVEEGVFWDTVLEVLKEKAAQGVEVRVMYDDVGSGNTLPFRYQKKLEKAGLKAQAFNPFRPFVSALHNNRDHRKIAVIDNAVAFTGGINFADEYINEKRRFGTWKDTGVMLKGRGVASMTAVFLSLWDLQSSKPTDYKEYLGYYPPQEEIEKNKEAQGGYTVCFGDGPRPFYEEQIGKNVYLNILGSATKYVYIFTPYLICDNQTLSAIRLAAKRGVDVRLVTPHIPDKYLIYIITRSNYASLIESGVKIYEYTPGFIHAKSFVADDKYAVVGTINLDYRSLTHHFECGMWMYDTAAVLQLRDDAERTMAQGQQVTLREARLNPAQKLFKSIVQVFTPLL